MDRARGTTLLLTAVVVAAVAALVVTATLRAGRQAESTAVSTADSTADSRPPAPADAVVPVDVTLREVVRSVVALRDWDRERAAAWRAGDVAALRSLYLPGSRAGERDAAMLRTWVGRGLRVRGMVMQVLAVELRVRTARRMVLVVTDRLAGPVAVGRDGRRWTLPRDGVTTRRLEFRRTGGRWLLAAVYDRPARPLATTASTSGSANS